jgi:hypothetical protein
MPKGSGKDDRLFAPFPIEMDEHPKIIGLSDAAFRAVFEATFYSRRMMSDGFLDERVVLRRWGQAVADELGSNDPERPSWIRVERGWRIHDFEKHHPLRSEIEAKRREISDRRREAGSKGAASRWQTDSKPPASHSSETETETETRPKRPSPPLAEEFDKFWGEYPRKEGKGDARKAFAAARKKTDLDTIMSGLNRYKLASLLIEKQFVKMPGPWLRAERWDDEPVAGTPSPELVKDVFCRFHDYYPMPCAKCAREEGENAF